MMTLRDRIFDLIKKEDLNPNQFYNLTGLGNGYLDKIGEVLRKPTIEKIRNRFPLWNINWILTGEGNMYTDVPRNKTINNITGDISGGTFIGGNGINVGNKTYKTYKEIDPNYNIAGEHTEKYMAAGDLQKENGQLQDEIKLLKKEISVLKELIDKLLQNK